jgi:hypothetical protein
LKRSSLVATTELLPTDAGPALHVGLFIQLRNESEQKENDLTPAEMYGTCSLTTTGIQASAPPNSVDTVYLQWSRPIISSERTGFDIYRTAIDEFAQEFPWGDVAFRGRFKTVVP